MSSYLKGARSIDNKIIAKVIFDILNLRTNAESEDEKTIISAQLHDLVYNATYDKGNSFDLISEEAFKIIQTDYADDFKIFKDHVTTCHTHRKIVQEHVIPVRIILELFEKKTDDHTISREFIEKCLEIGRVALISKDEDILLTKVKLRARMPKPFDIEKDDPLMRYREVGILLHRWPDNFEVTDKDIDK